MVLFRTRARRRCLPRDDAGLRGNPKPVTIFMVGTREVSPVVPKTLRPWQPS